MSVAGAAVHYLGMKTAGSLVAIVLLLGLVSCGATEGSQPAEPDVTGIVTAVRGAGLGRVEGFTLKDGRNVYEIEIDPEIEYGFPLDHLRAHQASSEPVRVMFLERDGKKIATLIEDAPAPVDP